MGFQNADIVADQRFSGCRLTQRAPTDDAVKDLRPLARAAVRQAHDLNLLPGPRGG